MEYYSGNRIAATEISRRWNKLLFFSRQPFEHFVSVAGFFKIKNAFISSFLMIEIIFALLFAIGNPSENSFGVFFFRFVSVPNQKRKENNISFVRCSSCSFAYICFRNCSNCMRREIKLKETSNEQAMWKLRMLFGYCVACLINSILFIYLNNFLLIF